MTKRSWSWNEAAPGGGGAPKGGAVGTTPPQHPVPEGQAPKRRRSYTPEPRWACHTTGRWFRVSRIPRPIVDQIREATDIVAVVSKHVRLERKGNTWLGLCPFHQERTPSFNVIPNKAMYYCFGCQAGGDCFRFLMQLEGLSFVEAVKELAQAAGIVIPERELTPEERKALRQRAQWFDAMDEAAAFYESG